MAFIPYEKFQLATNMNVFHAKEKISEITVPRGSTVRAHSKPFQGEINNHILKITRRSEDFTPFYPVILGVIQDNTINFTIRLNLPALFKMFIGLGAIIMMAFIMWDRQIYLGVVFSILIIIIGYTMSTMYFKTEANVVKKILEKAFSK